MRNITKYVKENGNKSFSRLQLNYVDCLIFAQMSYINWELVAPTLKSKKRRGVAFKNVPDEINKEINAGEFDSKKSEKLFMIMKNSTRYKNCKVKYVHKIDDCDRCEQFFAATIVLPDKTNIIVYRGTDLTINGWKEDCALAVLREIPAQTTAVRYAEKVMNLTPGNYYFIGHSKGGNLAHYAAIKIETELKNRLIKAISFDGPGFHSSRTYESEKYQAVADKLIKFVPRDSVVGTMLNTLKETYVVESNAIAVFQHDPFTWKINSKYGFKTAEKRTLLSHINEEMLADFLGSMDLEQRQEVIDSVFGLVGDPNQTLIDIAKHIPKSIIHFNKTYSEYSPEKKKMLGWTLAKILHSYKKAAVTVVKEKLKKHEKHGEITKK